MEPQVKCPDCGAPYDAGSYCSCPSGRARYAADGKFFEAAAQRPVPAPELDRKDTNPKDSVGCAKAPLSVVPMGPLYEVGLGLFEGARKYGRHNWRAAGVRHSIYFDAAMRHLAAWWEGQDIDPDSGLHHVVKAIAGLLVLRDSMLCGNDVDDRPPVMNLDFDHLNASAAEIIERYPDALPAHTER